MRCWLKPWVILLVVATSISELVSMAISKNKPNVKRRKEMWGWDSPEMDEHWERFFSAPDLHHTSANLGSEWTRLDAQRGYKFFGGLGIFIGAVIGLTIGLLF